MFVRFDNNLSNSDLLMTPPGGGAPAAYLATPAPIRELGGRLSPDGRWAAYQSNEAGRYEVYVQAFPPTGGKWQVSLSGGRNPRWRSDGRELFFEQADAIYAAPVAVNGGALDFGRPVKLFEHRLAHGDRERTAGRCHATASGSS